MARSGSSTNRPDTFAQTIITRYIDLACNLTADHTIPTDCGTSITPGVTNFVANYVQASTTATVKTMFRYPGIPSSFALHGFSKMRVEQQ
jgi:hypothetical protein